MNPTSRSESSSSVPDPTPDIFIAASLSEASDHVPLQDPYHGIEESSLSVSSLTCIYMERMIVFM